MARLRDKAEEICKAIDAHKWQNSKYLPRTSHGIDWSNPETAVKCLEHLETYAEAAENEAKRCRELIAFIQFTQAAKATT